MYPYLPDNHRHWIVRSCPLTVRDCNSGGISETSRVVAMRDDRHSFHDVAQLSNIAGPCITLEHFRNLRREAFLAETISDAHVFEEISRQRSDILAARAKGWNPDQYDAQTVEQILPEAGPEARRNSTLQTDRQMPGSRGECVREGTLCSYSRLLDHSQERSARTLHLSGQDAANA